VLDNQILLYICSLNMFLVLQKIILFSFSFCKNINNFNYYFLVSLFMVTLSLSVENIN